MARAGGKRSVGPSGSASSAQTRAALVQGAVAALREVGFAGASAREIARRAGCNQALVFYHFGSVAKLHLEALDAVSAARDARYRAVVAESKNVRDLVRAARTVFDEDLDQGHVTVLVEMIAAAQFTPELRPEVAARIRPWRTFAADSVRDALAGSPAARLLPPEEAAHAIVALYLGLEMLANLEEEREPALALFDRAGKIASLLDIFKRKKKP
ncbi:transcriptional regulator, TetR family [Streptomyces sp. DvalAA-14]|uniref:TetR/AcrR family transcriptional regulator n=1 Tax=unclassified Streptomyces TaxID=2593676 RepID=UPI00081B310B|nr:TetR/AcrR family transcriptional regulator [Streptomyces sp. DvalAA-14]MYS23315.1 TetR family transcriptional regulator [Streptomyces sp. SID4948]SCE31435.1 transcriptional regulator, TetR family [Streptomyces sp. DvalAA-14]